MVTLHLDKAPIAVICYMSVLDQYDAWGAIYGEQIARKDCQGLPTWGEASFLENDRVPLFAQLSHLQLPTPY